MRARRTTYAGPNDSPVNSGNSSPMGSGLNGPAGRPNVARTSMNGGHMPSPPPAAAPNWVRAMHADQGNAFPMSSGQDLRGIPVIEDPESDEDRASGGKLRPMPPPRGSMNGRESASQLPYALSPVGRSPMGRGMHGAEDAVSNGGGGQVVQVRPMAVHDTRGGGSAIRVSHGGK